MSPKQIAQLSKNTRMDKLETTVTQLASTLSQLTSIISQQGKTLEVLAQAQTRKNREILAAALTHSLAYPTSGDSKIPVRQLLQPPPSTPPAAPASPVTPTEPPAPRP